MRCNSLLVLLVLFAVGVFLSRSDPPAGIPCKKVGDDPNCVCHHPNGIIDLRPLSSKDGPKFNNTDLVDSGGFRYYYNPCAVFNLTDGCRSTYACQESADATSHYPLANQGTEMMYYDVKHDKSSIILYYSYPVDDGNLRETKVHLICNQDSVSGQEKISTTGDSEVQLTYEFTLTTCHACPGGCHEHHHEGGGGIAGPIGLSQAMILAPPRILFCFVCLLALIA